MTVSQAISKADAQKVNDFTNDTKVQWLNEVEGYVHTEVLLRDPDDFDPYTWTDDQTTTLVVAAPHDKIYYTYLCAMIDFANGEYNKYADTMKLFEQFLREYESWFAKYYMPARTDEDGEELPPYYLTAYGIAQKHGYTGTETEWLASLKGATGDTGPTGAAIVSTVLIGQDANGGNIYQQTFDDDSTAQFTAPKGAKGDTGATGATGPTGATGATGATGEAGADGVSPGITISDITGGHRIKITDASHPSGQTVDVMDGADGADGQDGATGATGPAGTAAGFGAPAASASALPSNYSPTVQVSATGPDTEKVFTFDFGIPKGEKGNTVFATFEIDADTGELEQTNADDIGDIEFTLNDSGELEVEINE